MHDFKLPAMSCGHCVQAVTEAAKEVDPQARVEVDLARKEAKVGVYAISGFLPICIRMQGFESALHR